MNSASETPHAMDVNKLNLSENDWLKVLTNLSSSSMSSLQETLKRLKEGSLQMQTEAMNKIMNPTTQQVGLQNNTTAGVVVNSPKPNTGATVGVPMALNAASPATPIMGNTIQLPVSMLNQVSGLQSTNILGSTGFGPPTTPGGTQTIVLALASPSPQNSVPQSPQNKSIKQVTNFGPRCVTLNQVLAANGAFPAQGMLATSSVVNTGINTQTLAPVLNNINLNTTVPVSAPLPTQKPEVPMQLNLAVSTADTPKVSNEASSSLYALATAAVEAFKEVDIDNVKNKCNGNSEQEVELSKPAPSSPKPSVDKSEPVTKSKKVETKDISTKQEPSTKPEPETRQSRSKSKSPSDATIAVALQQTKRVTTRNQAKAAAAAIKAGATPAVSSSPKERSPSPSKESNCGDSDVTMAKRSRLTVNTDLPDVKEPEIKFLSNSGDTNEISDSESNSASDIGNNSHTSKNGNSSASQQGGKSSGHTNPRGAGRPSKNHFSLDDSIDDDEAVRRAKRRERNRVAAARCRQRRQDQIGNLQKDVTELYQNGECLRTQLRYLDCERARLERIIHQHNRSACPHTFPLNPHSPLDERPKPSLSSILGCEPSELEEKLAQTAAMPHARSSKHPHTTHTVGTSALTSTISSSNAASGMGNVTVGRTTSSRKSRQLKSAHSSDIGDHDEALDTDEDQDDEEDDDDDESRDSQDSNDEEEDCDDIQNSQKSKHDNKVDSNHQKDNGDLNESKQSLAKNVPDVEDDKRSIASNASSRVSAQNAPADLSVKKSVLRPTTLLPVKDTQQHQSNGGCVQPTSVTSVAAASSLPTSAVLPNAAAGIGGLLVTTHVSLSNTNNTNLVSLSNIGSLVTANGCLPDKALNLKNLSVSNATTLSGAQTIPGALVNPYSPLLTPSTLRLLGQLSGTPTLQSAAAATTALHPVSTALGQFAARQGCVSLLSPQTAAVSAGPAGVSTATPLPGATGLEVGGGGGQLLALAATNAAAAVAQSTALLPPGTDTGGMQLFRVVANTGQAQQVHAQAPQPTKHR